MKIPDNNIISKKSVKNQKEADEKPYFENTHPIFTPEWIDYKQPMKAKEEQEEEEEEKNAPKGKALLKKIYGGAVPKDPVLYGKAKAIADKTYSKPSAYKSGFIQKKYKEMGGEYKDDGERPLERWYKEKWIDIGKKDYPVYRPTKRVSAKTPLTASEIDPKQAVKQIALKQKIKGKANLPPFSPNQLIEKGGCNGVKTCRPCDKMADRAVGKYQEVIAHLEEHLKEKAGDPKDAKQSKELKKEVLKLNETHLIPANKIPKKDHLYKVSNPKMVQQKAKKLYGKDAIIYKSSKPNKKYQILNPQGKWVHFGDAKMEDYNAHQNEQRRNSYLARATGIKGKWKEDHYSPNFLAITLLW